MATNKNSVGNVTPMYQKRKGFPFGLFIDHGITVTFAVFLQHDICCRHEPVIKQFER